MANAVDKEQIEMLKEWWNSYGKLLTLAILFGVVIGFVWRYWHQSQLGTAAHASQLYGQTQIAAAQGDSKKAEGTAAILMKNYTQTPYATMAALSSAQVAVNKKDYKMAQTQFNWVIKHSKIKALQQLAQIRLARILLTTGKTQQALATLKVVNDTSFQPAIDAVTGDIYFAMGDSKQAQSFYKKAQQGYAAVGVESPFIAMKEAR